MKRLVAWIRTLVVVAATIAALVASASTVTTATTSLATSRSSYTYDAAVDTAFAPSVDASQAAVEQTPNNRGRHLAVVPLVEPSPVPLVVAAEGGSVADQLGVAQSHLGSIDAMTGPNRMMLDRIAEAQQSEFDTMSNGCGSRCVLKGSGDDVEDRQHDRAVPVMEDSTLRVRRAGGDPKPPQCHVGQEPGWEATAETARYQRVR